MKFWMGTLDKALLFSAFPALIVGVMCADLITGRPQVSHELGEEPQPVRALQR